MKTTVVVESLSYCKTNVLFQRILQDFKINNHIFPNFLHITFLSVTQRSFDSMCCIIGFDGMLGGVRGVVYNVGFGVLSTVVIFT